MKYTYPIAVGRKGISHEEVEKAFAMELYNLRSGTEKNYFYYAKTKSNIPVYLELFASLQDQPERRSCNYIMLENSTYSARWGYAIDLAAPVQYEPSSYEKYAEEKRRRNKERLREICGDDFNQLKINTMKVSH